MRARRRQRDMTLARSLRLGLLAYLWMRSDGVRERYGVPLNELLARQLEIMGGLAEEW